MRAAVTHATTVAAIGVLPTFLIGTLAIQLRDDLGVTVDLLGIATTGFFAAAALLAPLGGRLVRRVGSTIGMIIAPAISLVALLVGAAAVSYPMLVLAMALAGAANSVAQPVANLRLAEFVRDGRLATAFGLKQASVPAAALFAGLAVPAIALAFGWRWVWVVAAAFALITCVSGAVLRGGRSSHSSDMPSRASRQLSRTTMFTFTIGGALASAVGSAIAVFFVSAAVSTGFLSATAAALFAGFSVVGIFVRIGLGIISDKLPAVNSYLLMATLSTIGAFGFALLALGGSWQFVIGGLLAYIFGWAWPGLLHFAIVRDNRGNAATATSFLMGGLSAGSAFGPLFFGFLIAATSYQAAWITCTVMGLAAATMMTIGSRIVRRTA